MSAIIFSSIQAAIRALSSPDTGSEMQEISGRYRRIFYTVRVSDKTEIVRNEADDELDRKGYVGYAGIQCVLDSTLRVLLCLLRYLLKVSSSWVRYIKRIITLGYSLFSNFIQGVTLIFITAT